MHYLRNLLIGMLVILAVSSTASAIVSVPSDELQYSNNTSSTYGNSYYCCTYNYATIVNNTTGVQRYSWQWYVTGGTGYSMVYKNGVAISSEQTTTSTGWTTATTEISQTLSVGDVVGIRIHGSSGLYIQALRNFSLSYTNRTEGIYGQVYTLVNGVEVPISGAEVRLWNTSNLGNSTSYITGSTGSYYFEYTQAGTYYLQALKGDEYDPSATEIITVGTNEPREKNILMAGCTAAYNCFANIVNPTFTAWNNSTGLPIENASVLVTKYGSSDTVASDTTGTDGAISVKLLKTQRYNVTITSPISNNTTGTWTGYPQQTNYAVPVGSGTSGGQPYNASSWTNTTSPGTAGGISNFTSTYLNSSIGLGLMGQGILVGITSWFVVGAGGGLAALAVLFAYVYLGLISMVSLIIMTFTMISIYILRGKI